MPVAGWVVTLTKSRATWSYFTRNPQGGGFGSNVDGGFPQWMAWAAAVQNIPDGTRYGLVVNGKDRGEVVKGSEAWRARGRGR